MTSLTRTKTPPPSSSSPPPDGPRPNLDTKTAPPCEDTLITFPAAIVHLIDKQQSVELASGDLSIVRLRQGDNVVAVLLRVGQDIQWPFVKDEASVKLDQAHYFFSLRVPERNDDDDEFLNYGLAIASKGQDGLVKEFDGILEEYTSFSLQKATKEVSPKDASAAYWTTLAPNVEDYSGSLARATASGSGSLIKRILWCGDVTVDGLKWGHQFLKKRMEPAGSRELDPSPAALRRLKRVKKISKKSEHVTSGIFSRAVKVSGFLTTSIVNSRVGKKIFSRLPGEVALASLDGFSKVFNAVEVAGKNVMSTASTVTTDLVSHGYGEKAAGATNEGLNAAGHAVGTVWAVFKISEALSEGLLEPAKRAKESTSAAAAAAAERSSSPNSIKPEVSLQLNLFPSAKIS